VPYRRLLVLGTATPQPRRYPHRDRRRRRGVAALAQAVHLSIMLAGFGWRTPPPSVGPSWRRPKVVGDVTQHLTALVDDGAIQTKPWTVPS